ncbi:MAG: hypothetical protein C0605_16085 [Hyphomicrobiales bacterium]|nr:MAG: hypothetical protein C0605_16085 [Hyphomicrobiales bacterium]
MNDPEADKFYKLLMGEDELGVVIRSHIFVESVLDELLDQLIPYSRHLSSMNLSYHQKITLAVAMGLHEELQESLKALGKLRNDFAHKMDMQLDPAP